ncbi:hypothetical protein GLOTRDRAFT_125059 [Gloeophyllum trabeum ATCC 11539]|uniref:Uncharacterized protein n=1 Tax=Gloeophyllum trabeum (strain ATCC 11539 / FP-39264 / Madison 617) TaxID=670483 RepID=S7QP87_GLOTA|nr:uncharacterized protein GLOTRDRAFT_125059 [Gloeophyllum trabeum ATCC 11539]EPQ61338.1 hypothetical protein GLOTRDRAFT_125059 [Gloeophyllum trabeum ATCC 11539]
MTHAPIRQRVDAAISLAHSKLACADARADYETRERLLADPLVITLPSDAARAGIAMGNLNGALELLEAGLSMLWTQIFQFRTPMSDLMEADAALASDLRGRLEHWNGSITSLLTNFNDLIFDDISRPAWKI